MLTPRPGDTVTGALSRVSSYLKTNLTTMTQIRSLPASSKGRDSSVGIATRYGLDGPGIESRGGGEIFRTRPYRHWGPSSLIYKGYLLFSGGKTAGGGVDHPPHLSAEVMKE